MAIHRKIPTELCMTLTAIALFAAAVAAQTPQPTTQTTRGEGTVTTEKMSGEVVLVDGNNLVVRMSNGEFRTFSNVPDSRRALIDGKEVGVRDLTPGTKLTATITRTTTPVTVRTTTVGTGRVRYVAGSTVILTLPSGETKQYVVKPEYKFIVNGKPASVNELRAGMTVSAEKIVEEPTVDIATDTRVVGQAPRGQAAPAAASGGAAATGGAAAPGAAPARAGAASTASGAPPARLPKTGSPIPFVGLLGLLLVGGSSAIRMLRRR